MQKLSPYCKVVRHVEELRELVRQAVEVCLGIKDGENVWIHSWDHTTDLASDIAFACRRAGAQPLVTLVTEDYWMRPLVETPKKLLETLPSHQAAALEHTDAFIFMLGPKSSIDWNQIPPEKRELANVWYSDSNKYLDSWRKIAQENSVRMLGIEYCLVTEESSRSRGLEHTRWREVMLAGCITDQRENREKSRRTSQNHPRQPRGKCSNTLRHRPQIQPSRTRAIIGDRSSARRTPPGHREVSAVRLRGDGPGRR